MTRVTDILLERYLANDLTPDEARRIETRLETDTELATRLEQLRHSDQAFLEAVPSEIFARRTQARLEGHAPGRISWRETFQRLSWSIATVCVCLGAYWFTQNPATFGVQELAPTIEQGIELSQQSKKASPPKLTDPNSHRSEGARQLAAAPAPENPVSEIDKPARKPKPAPAQPARRSARRAHQPSIAVQEADKPGSVNVLPTQPLKKKARRTSISRQAAAEPKVSEESGRAGPEGRGIRTRLLMRPALHSGPGKIYLRNSKGHLRVPAKPIRPNPDDTLVLRLDTDEDAYWTFAMTAQGSDKPLVQAGRLQSYVANAVITIPASVKGPVTIWVFLSSQPFSTEKILFDGFSYRSDEEEIRISPFFAIF